MALQELAVIAAGIATLAETPQDLGDVAGGRLS